MKTPMKYIISMAHLAVLVFAGACQAQTMYRCGNNFSQQSCATDAKAVPIPAPGNCTDEHMRFSQYCKDQDAKKQKVAAQLYERELADRRERDERELVFQKKQSEKAAEDYKNQLSSQSEASSRQIEERNKRLALSFSKIESNKARCVSEIKATLKDPESAVFSEVERGKLANDYTVKPVSPSVWYAVTVNAKNSFGAFSGRKQQFCAFDLDENNILYIR